MSNIVTAKQYEAARDMLPANSQKYLLNTVFNPTFTGEGGNFFYARELFADGEKGKKYTLVKPNEKTEYELFNHEKLAEALSEELGREVKPYNLPLVNVFIDKSGKIMFLIDGSLYEWDNSKDNLRKVGLSIKLGENLSPNKMYAAFVKDHNLFIRNVFTGEITQVTSDGEEYFEYAGTNDSDTTPISRKLTGTNPPAGVLWSPDSKKLLTYKLDQRNVKDLYLIQSVPAGDTPERPVLHKYKYQMAIDKDEELAYSSIYIYDLEKKTLKESKCGKYISNFFPPFAPGFDVAVWCDDGINYITYIMSRDFKKAGIYKVNAETGEYNHLFDEETDTFLFFDFYKGINYEQGVDFLSVKLAHFYENSNKMLWLSNRDGNFHIYSCDLNCKEPVTQITKGQWTVRELMRVDEKNGRIYFTASGREEGVNPYYKMLYSINLDGTDMKPLTPENANHIIHFSPGLSCFTDCYSTVDKPQKVIVRDVQGQQLMDVVRADATKLIERCLTMPKQFCVKAADGETDIYGILVLPPDFDPNKKYPMIDCYYGGVQVSNVPKNFIGGVAAGYSESLAQLGFVCMIVDGRGTPLRSKAFHDYAHQNLASCAGMEDHIAAIKQLLKRYNFLDGERIGVWGHSGGGYAAYKCLIEHGDVYKVAVSGGANHIQEIYISYWSERFMNRYDKELWRKQSSEGDASKLNGKLLLIHGELDDNTHPANTMRIVDSLIKADKDFDMLIIPNTHHNVSAHPYYVRRLWDYFVKNL